MVTKKINLSAVQGMRSHAIEVQRLIKSLKPVSSKKSKNRRLLLLRKTLSQFKIAYSWHGLNTLVIEPLPYTRPGITIHVETLPTPGGGIPIQYFVIQQGVTFNRFAVPCSSDYELLKKLYRFKLLSYDEVIKPMLAEFNPVAQ